MQKSGYCLICFQSLFDHPSISNIISTKCICPSCQKKFIKINKKEEIEGISIWFLYRYNEFAKEIIYKYKGCYDYELKDVFLWEYRSKIKALYKGYTIIYPPSYEGDDKKRGFRHIEEIVKTLNLSYENIFYKKSNYKQSNQHFADRKNIKKQILVKGKISNKKYLIIDDIYTSGSTINAIINILINHHINKRNIKVIILFKVE